MLLAQPQFRTLASIRANPNFRIELSGGDSVKIAKYNGEFPSIPFLNGDRVFADVTIDCEGDDPYAENTAVDVAPARINVYFCGHGLIRMYDFRVVTTNRFLHLCSSWLSASFGRALPIAQRDIHRHDRVSVHIEPPWPLDFRLLIRFNSETDADRIMSLLTSHHNTSDHKLNRKLRCGITKW
jgi:hypothetical protein